MSWHNQCLSRLVSSGLKGLWRDRSLKRCRHGVRGGCDGCQADAVEPLNVRRYDLHCRIGDLEAAVVRMAATLRARVYLLGAVKHRSE